MAFIVQQKIKGRIYLYSVESYYDKVTKKVKQRRKYLGPKLEDKLTEKSTIPQKFIIKNFGNIYFLNFLIEKSGLKKILQTVFPNDFLDIINLVCYQICQAEASYLFHYWFEEQFFTNCKNLYSDDISDFFVRMGNAKSQRIDFNQQWIELQKPVKTIFYDITSISSYSKNIDLVEWGYNRDKENLPQINLGIIYSQDNHVPLWYNVFAGSIVDVSTLRNSIIYTNYFKLNDILFVLDCGFFSKSNISEMNNENNRIKFIMPMSHTTKVSDQIITKFGKKISSVDSAILFNNQIIHYQKTNIDYQKNNLDVHIFLNQAIKFETENHFLSIILEFENKHNNKIFNTLKEFSDFKKSEIPDKIKSYFKWNKTNLTIEKDMPRIKKELNKSGCFMLTTNDKELDKLDVLKYYRNKDLVEKVFDSVKNEMDTKRLRTHKQESTEGKLFIKFISAILYSLIGKTMEEKQLYKTMSIKELIYEMQKIKITVLDDNTKNYSVLTKRQKKILESFEMPNVF